MPLLFFSPQPPSPRLRYVLDWVLGERLKVAYRLIESDTFPDAVGALGYGYNIIHPLHIPSSGLLADGAHDWSGIPFEAWLDLPSSSLGFQFDVLSSIFFLLSRVEELDDSDLDRHGRYKASNSKLHHLGLLEKPIVDIWVMQFGKLLESHLNLTCYTSLFSFQPSYDIDLPWSYKYKGFKRSIGGLLRDVSQGNFSFLKKRIKVLLRLEDDPYDAFLRMKKLHEEAEVRPLYFILAALQTGSFDKNISPFHPQMKTLVKKLAKEGDMGMHPSYYSTIKPEKMVEEKKALEEITDSSITKSRQHYIRYSIPTTPALLIENGVSDDYSMGYPVALGFRAGTSQPFNYYDLENEKSTPLRLHPFCFMDTTALYDLNLPVETAFEKLKAMEQELKLYGGNLTTVFHNFSLGTAPEWQDWWNAYRDFVLNIHTNP